MYACEFPPCSYSSKRESNCKQHMEKTHNWTYVRAKRNKGSIAGSVPPTPSEPMLTPLHISPHYSPAAVAMTPSTPALTPAVPPITPSTPATPMDVTPHFTPDSVFTPSPWFNNDPSAFGPFMKPQPECRDSGVPNFGFQAFAQPSPAPVTADVNMTGLNAPLHSIEESAVNFNLDNLVQQADMDATAGAEQSIDALLQQLMQFQNGQLPQFQNIQFPQFQAGQLDMGTAVFPDEGFADDVGFNTDDFLLFPDSTESGMVEIPGALAQPNLFPDANASPDMWFQ